MGILVPRPGIESDWEHALGPLHWEHGILATGPPGKFLYWSFLRQSPESQFKSRLTGLCYGLNVWPLHSYVVILTNLVMVFGGGAFGSDEVMRVESSWVGLMPLCESSLVLLTRTQWEDSEEAGFRETSNLPAPWSWTFQCLDLWEMNVYCL